MRKMVEKPLSSGQNAFPRSFFLGFGGVFVLKSAFGFLIRAPEVPFLVPLKSVNYPKSGLVLADLGKAFWPLKSGVLAILHFLRDFTNFAFSTVKMVNS